MYYYKITVVDNMLETGVSEEDADELRCADEDYRKRRILSAAEEYNERHKGRKLYVSEILFDRIICAAVSKDCLDSDKTISVFLDSQGIPASDVKVEETTLMNFRKYLCTSSENDFIEDDDDELERLNVGSIIRAKGRSLYFGEAILAKTIRKTALYAAAEKTAAETFLPELDRIYAASNAQKTIGHPVHYLIKVGDPEARKEMHLTLLRALYANGRIQSRRYCVVNAGSGIVTQPDAFESLYKNCAGGVIIVRFMDDEASERESDLANVQYELIRIVCSTMKKNRHQVLTVFCLPRECEHLSRMILNELGDVAVIQIQEDRFNNAHAAKYLDELCQKQRISPDEELHALLAEEERYYPEELRSLFDGWFNRKMRTDVYPQYTDIPITVSKTVKAPPKGTAFDELNEMVGLKRAKAVIGKALNYFKLQKLYRDKGIPVNRPAMHMIFTGNPGTAKTTTARLFARIMKENGILSSGHLVEVGRSDLVGKYVGWTAQTVQDKFEEAMGGVLFIDEAYALVDDRHGSFGDEAINTIVQEMENRREDLIVIFAGYPNEMETFLQNNPGLKSRIAFHVPFDDYDSGELCEIAKTIGKRQGIGFTEEALKKLHETFDTARKQADFGNGRYVRNLVELSCMNLANRLSDKDSDQLTDKDLTTLEEADIEFPIPTIQEQTLRIGFIA